MRRLGKRHILSVFVSLALLSACGQESDSAADSDAASDAASATLENGMTAKEVIEARQAQLKKFGKAFKTINDQLKSSSPDLAAIQAAAASLPVESAGMVDWFPEGTGPEAGIETDALPKIWETRAAFDQKISDFQAAAAQLNIVAQAGDLAAIGPAFGATGGTCKGCHDDYRLDD